MARGLEILSHRGYWKTPAEKNAAVAFARSFELGFGTETDVRDLGGRLVISHDPPGHDAMPIERFLEAYRASGIAAPLALNIKADGLQGMLKRALDATGVTTAFVFDMAVPDALGYLREGFTVFTRHSELEPTPAYYDRAAGVWLDAFFGQWYNLDTIVRHLDAGKQVCLVSPDLHRRDHRPTWDLLGNSGLLDRPGLMICTDFPEEARSVLHGSH
jgi:hypothetical protein